MVTTIRIPSYAGLVWKKFQRFDTAQNMKTDNLLFFGIRPELLMRPKLFVNILDCAYLHIYLK